MFEKKSRRVLGTLGAVAVTVVALAGPAMAHVTVNPDEAEQGGYAKLTFRVPNESDTAGTIKLRVTFPADTPVPSMRTKPLPGWKAVVVKKKLDKPVKGKDFDITEAVSTITWTADKGVRIAPGEFQEFEISGGPLPDSTESLALPAAQTYDDGKVVDWNQPSEEGKEEPEHPAPTLKLVKATGEGHHGGASAASATTPPAAGGSDSHAGSDEGHAAAIDTTARTLGSIGIGLAAICLVTAAFVAISVRKKNA